MDTVLTAIERATLAKRMIYSDFAAMPAIISDCEVGDPPADSPGQRLMTPTLLTIFAGVTTTRMLKN
jgi:hypothetical protein